MLKVIFRRLLWTVPLILAVSLLSFVLASLAPGSAAEAMLGIGATPEAVAALKHQMGWDRPMIEQYGSWLVNLLQGNLGVSGFNNRPVTAILADRLPATLSLTVLATVAVVVVGVALGMLTAVRGGSVAKVVDMVSTLLRGVPNFWLGLVLISVFAVSIRIFPVSGYVKFGDSPSEWLTSLALPVVSLAAGQVALIAIVVRAEMLVVFRSDFVRGLRANGISSRSILFKHGLKNAAGPVLTIVSLMFVGLFGGTIPVEQVFGIGGLGSQMVTSVGQHDLPVIQGIVMFYTVVVVVVFLVNDIAHAWVNPKVVAR
ncbi:ABC transporter permease [Paenarthrobacter sp. NPDC058040]|uniref:ABC transporter permease n=1 Tax=unclassified Paenarthrobacter TaxID=2634190 RepID=UPI0036D82C1B